MRKKIHKIWGVGLVLVLAVSLLFSAAPVSAGTLSWSAETIPSTTGKMVVSGTDVSDIAVGGDGTTIWVTDTEGDKLYKSTNAGQTWSEITKPTGAAEPQLVAIAPDDSDIVAIVADDKEVYVTTNGGTTWGSLGTVQEGTETAAAKLVDIAISPQSAGVHYVAVAGYEVGHKANVWYFNVGAAAPAWKDTNDQTGFGITTDNSTVAAVAFSPNFPSDQVLVALTEDDDGTTTGLDYIKLGMFSFSTKMWNADGGFSGYPVTIFSDTAINDLTSGSLSLSPEYLGSDEATWIVFVGLNIAGGTDEVKASGIYRVKGTGKKGLKTGSDVLIHSVAFDGANLVAGAYDNNKVYRCADPLVTSPTVSTASSLKRPGGDNKVVVAWAGADVVAGTSGNESAFAVSRNNGKSFNDISLIDTALTYLRDVAISADGSKVYLSTDDGTDFSLWRKASSWERVLAVDGKTDLIVRLAPEDPNVVYVADKGTKTIYFTEDAGDVKWFTRASRYNIQDLAVESTDVAYVAVYGKATVSKSTNRGFTWGSEKSTKLAGNVHTIVSLGEDKVIVGGTSGYVSYSTDGGSSWTKIAKQIETTAGNVQVTASGLSSGDFIYAASDKTGTKVLRWEIGKSTTWKDLAAPVDTTYKAYGIALQDGVLYVVTSDGTNSEVLRTLAPSAATVKWSEMDSTGEAFNVAPSALRVSTGSTKLWAIDTAGTDELFSYSDTLAETGPSLSAPKMGTIIPVNLVSGLSHTVSFTWERISKATEYDLQVATDMDFTAKVYTANVASTASTVAKVAPAGTFMPGTTYYWRVRVSSDGPIYSPWSETRSFAVEALPEPQPPVIVEEAPPPVLELPQPEITLQPPEIVLPEPPPPPPEIVIPPAPPPPAPITPAYIWAIIIIGAILVIAVIVLIVRTRRPV